MKFIGTFIKAAPRRTLPPIIISESHSSAVSSARRNLERGYLWSGWTNRDLPVSPSFPAAGKAKGRQVAGVVAFAPPHYIGLLGTTLSVLLAPPMTQRAVLRSSWLSATSHLLPFWWPVPMASHTGSQRGGTLDFPFNIHIFTLLYNAVTNKHIHTPVFWA